MTLLEENPTVDDVVEAVHTLEERMEESDDNGDILEADEAREIADKTFLDRLGHILEDDCDNETCNEIRSELAEFTHGDEPEEEDEESEIEEGEESEAGDDESEEVEEEAESEADDPEEDDGPKNAAFPDEL